MGLLDLLVTASMPILQVLIISFVGALLASDYVKLLNADARKYINKLVFVVLTPSLIFASLAKTVTFADIIAWWFMPVNIGLVFLFGGTLGWIVVKILKPKPYVEGLVIATCSAGNLGNLMLIIVPAICKEDGSPFGADHSVCATTGLSYASFSMALGGFYIWTYTYQLIQSSSLRYKTMKAAEEVLKEANKDLEANVKSPLLEGEINQEHVAIPVSKSPEDGHENQAIVSQNSSSEPKAKSRSFLAKTIVFIHQIIEELMAPPTLGAIVGLTFGAVTWLKQLIIGDNAPLRVIQDTAQLLGDGSIPCVTLILGGNLIQGLRQGKVKPSIIIAVICVRYVLLPLIGVGVVIGAAKLGLLPSDKLFQFVLMIQFTLPPAMNIGTMTQLFNVAQEECSVLFLWTYLVAAFSLTMWSTIFMWVLS